MGIDGELAKLAGEFIPLELIYEAAMEKTVGVPFLCPVLAHLRGKFEPKTGGYIDAILKFSVAGLLELIERRKNYI